MVDFQACYMYSQSFFHTEKKYLLSSGTFKHYKVLNLLIPYLKLKTLTNVISTIHLWHLLQTTMNFYV